MTTRIKLKGFNPRFAPAPKVERVLLHSNGTPVKIGDSVTSFRDEKATVKSWKHDGQNKMYVDWAEGGSGEYYPSVFDLKWAD